jgi:hypothetical protein
MNRQAGRIFTAALLGGLALLVAGCGSSHSNTTSTTTASTTTATTTTTAASNGTTTTTSTTSTSGQTTSTPSFSLLTSGNCGQLLNLSASLSQALSGGAQDIQKTAQLIKEFADKSPSAIRPDFEVLADDYAKIASALNGVDLSSGHVPSASELAKLSKLSSQLDTAKLTAASQHIAAWAQANCGTTTGG